MTHVALDIHDWTPSLHRLDLFLKLKEYFPNFKVSLFAIPEDQKMDYGPYLVRNDILKQVQQYTDWMQFIPHGLTHKSSREMKDVGHEFFKHTVIPSIKDAFFRDGLPMEKGFCAPHWRWNDEVVAALDEAGWWGAVYREEKGRFPRQYYQYNFLLNEPFWESDLPVLKLHGHTYGTKNDMEKCFDNLLRLPKDTIFHFVTDYLEQNI